MTHTQKLQYAALLLLCAAPRTFASTKDDKLSFTWYDAKDQGIHRWKCYKQAKHTPPQQAAYLALQKIHDHNKANLLFYILSEKTLKETPEEKTAPFNPKNEIDFDIDFYTKKDLETYFADASQPGSNLVLLNIRNENLKNQKDRTLRQNQMSIEHEYKNIRAAFLEYTQAVKAQKKGDEELIVYLPSKPKEDQKHDQAHGISGKQVVFSVVGILGVACVASMVMGSRRKEVQRRSKR